MDTLRRSTTDALLGGREKWTARWKRVVLLGWVGEEVGSRRGGGQWMRGNAEKYDGCTAGWEREVDC